MRNVAVFVLAVAFCPILASAQASTYQADVLYQLVVPAGFRTAQFSTMFGSRAVGKLEDPTGNPFAAVWFGNDPINLNPSGFTWSWGWGTDGVQQVGEGAGPTTGENRHALLWNGTAESVIDLNPAGFVSSEAMRIAGGQQVGNGVTAAGQKHALSWQGTASSVADLHPAGFISSYVNGTDGVHQVGAGGIAPPYTHALLWTGTAASAVDLNPAGFVSSSATDISGSQEVGGGYTGTQGHALLWTGTAASSIDLNPTGFTSTGAQSTNGTQQVGYGYGPVTAGDPHALLWNGSANSYVDLNGFLSPGYTLSVAYQIDAGGNVFGIADDTSGNYYAVEWTPVPEPGSIALFSLAAALLLPKVRRIH